MKTIWKAITERGPIGWFRRLFAVVSAYGHDIQTIAQHVDVLSDKTDAIERYVRRATKVHADISTTANSPSMVVVCGAYRGKDYVRVFPLQHDSVDNIVDWLNNMSQYGKIGRLEMPPTLDVTVRRELKDKGVTI